MSSHVCPRVFKTNKMGTAENRGGVFLAVAHSKTVTSASNMLLRCVQINRHAFASARLDHVGRNWRDVKILF